MNVIDLFCGCGGLSLGFLKDNHKIVKAVEFDKNIAESYQKNHPNIDLIVDDIRNVDNNNVFKNNMADIIIGGPPCQGFSMAGARIREGFIEDPRNFLFKSYFNVVKCVKPKAFVFENVVGILSMDKGKLFKQIQAEFEELGYKLKYKVLNAVDYGVPQQRERVILVGFRGENNFEYPMPTHGEGLKPHVTLRQAIGDLPVIKSGQSSSTYAYQADNDFLHFVRDASQGLTEHSAPKNGDHLIKIMETLKDGQSKDDLPEDIRPKSGYGNTYAKLWWDRPSTTITRNFACPSSSRCIHPRDSRAMSIREGARLQSFPDDYKFYGSDGMKRLEIGNAVPPLLSMAIAKKVLEALEEE